MTDKLDDLKSKSADLASSVASNLSGSGVSSFGSAASFERGQSRTKTALSKLAPLLVKLKNKGLNPALLSQIANLDPAEALRMAQSFDALSAADLRSVNSDYKSVASSAASIGAQVADANYGPQIKAAQAAVVLAQKQLNAADKNAAAITKAISAEGEKLRKVIGKALGLPGYASGGYITGPGTSRSDSINARLSNGEFVMNAAATRRNRLQLEAMNNGFAAGGYVQPAYVRSGSSGSIDYDRLAAAINAGSKKTFAPTYNVQPIQGADPQTVLTVLGRELSRGMAGMG